MASALVGLASFYELGHGFEDFIDFSSFAVDKIIGIQLQKIMIFDILLQSPMTLFVVGVVGGVLSDSFFLLFGGLL